MRRLITACFLVVSFTTYSQDKVSLELNHVSVSEAINLFTEASGYRFAYNPDILSNEEVTASLSNASLEKAVDVVFAKHYDYKIRGSYVILLPKHGTATGASQRTEPITIQGEIFEEGTNKKLENVSVYEIQTLKPVLTNKSGDYSIDVEIPEDMAFLAISKANYQDTIIQVKKNSIWSITLKKKKESVEKSVKEVVFDKFNGREVQTHDENINLTERRWIHFALTPGVSTNGFISGQFTNKFSTNLLAGYSYALEGLEIGGALNMERSYVRGVQISGFLNINGDYLQGVQMAGASNITLGSVRGVQMGAFSNHAKSLDKGMQMGGAVNIVLGPVKGLQLAGFSNHAYSLENGVQMAGAVNTSKEGKGSQWSGFANWNRGTFEGLQISSFLNYTKNLKGLQIGIVNIADSVKSGFMIGLINWTKNGIHHFEVSANDITPYNIGFRSGVYPFYVVLQVGFDPYNANLWDTGYGFGTMVHFKGKSFLDIESTYHQLQPLDKGYIDGANVEGRLKVRFGYDLAKHIHLIGGPVVHLFHFQPDNSEDIEFAERFGKHPFTKSASETRITKAWVGYEFAVRF